MHPAMLFVPGGDPKKLDKIGSLDARAFLLDLEDGVAPAAKPAAREHIPEAIGRYAEGRHLWVRVNALDSGELYDDLQAVVVAGVEGINLPKVQAAFDLELTAWLVGELERRRGIEPGSVALMATIETARGLSRLEEIAAAAPGRLEALVFGAADFSRDLGLDWPPPSGSLSPAVLQAKSALVHASAAHGLEAPHDGASAEFRDLERLRAEAEGARVLGFGGKHAIHPAQLPVIEETFRPSQAQVAWARRVVEEFEHHQAAGVGAFALDGRMVDAPVAARARQILAQTGEKP